MFANFLNNNNENVNINKKMVVNTTRFLTNNERIELKRDLNNGKNINKKMSSMVARRLNGLDLSALEISPLKLGFFNAIVNGTFNKKERINLIDIFKKFKPTSKKEINGTNLKIEIKSKKLYYGQFKVGAEHSLSGIFGNVDPKKNYFMMQIAATVYDKNESQGITFRIYRNGKIHFSGGIMNNDITQPKKIHKYIVDNFTQREKFLYSPIKFNNTSGQFTVNAAINLGGVARAFRISSTMNYEPELRAALRMDYLGSSFQLFSSGIIQILGVTDDKEMLRAYDVGKDLIVQLYAMNLLTLSNKPGKTKKSKKVVNLNEIPLAKLAKKLKAPSPKNAVTYNPKKNSIKIDRKACASLPKPELVAVAKRLGVINFKSTTSREKICDLIKLKTFGNFKVDDKPCLSYTKSQLIPLAIAKKIPVTDADTVQSLCDKLKSRRENRRSPVVQKKVSPTNDKRRLSNKAIKENLEKLYGKRWMKSYSSVMDLDKNVDNIKKRIEVLNLKKNKKGVPFKKNVNALKKSSVSAWKFERKKMLNNKLNALNNNLANELNNLMNVEIVEKKKSPKKKFLKGTKVEEL